jgi:hypothetical protein
VPETGTRFWGDPERESVSGTERENLPHEVESGVTYHDSSIRLRIASELTRGEFGPEDRPKEE